MGSTVQFQPSSFGTSQIPRFFGDCTENRYVVVGAVPRTRTLTTSILPGSYDLSVPTVMLASIVDAMVVAAAATPGAAASPTARPVAAAILAAREKASA